MQYLIAHATANPDRKPIVVLATDGEPQGCTGLERSAIVDLHAEQAVVRLFTLAAARGLAALTGLAAVVGPSAAGGL